MIERIIVFDYYQVNRHVHQYDAQYHVLTCFVGSTLIGTAGHGIFFVKSCVSLILHCFNNFLRKII